MHEQFNLPTEAKRLTLQESAPCDLARLGPAVSARDGRSKAPPPLNAEEIFQLGFRIEQDLGPEAYRDVMQATNVLINSNPSGLLLRSQDFKVRVACLGWLAGIFGEKSLEEVLKELPQ